MAWWVVVITTEVFAECSWRDFSNDGILGFFEGFQVMLSGFKQSFVDYKCHEAEQFFFEPTAVSNSSDSVRGWKIMNSKALPARHGTFCLSEKPLQ